MLNYLYAAQRRQSTMITASYFLFFFLAAQWSGIVKSDFSSEEFHSRFSKASCEFALDLLKVASNEPDENFLFSPSSITVLLSILQQGAKENTASQLEKVLRLTAKDSKIGFGHVLKSLNTEKKNLTLEWGNRVFVVPGFNLNEGFLKNVEENFNATFEELDFNSTDANEAATKINDWVKEVTHNNIQNLVDSSLLSSDVVMIMVNAIYFKGIWNSPFQKFRTRSDKFQTSNETKIEASFMRQAGRFVAGEDNELEIKWVELPFKDENFSMIFILPNKPDGIDYVVEKLSGHNLRHIISSQNTRRVKLIIPKFKLTKKVFLAENLKELGLTDIFTNESNLKGISNSDKILLLSQLVHQADVEIDEDGSTAAAATFEIVQTLSFEWFTDELYFRADHPFLFFIVDKLNEVPIFAGKVVNPESSVPN